MSQSFDHDHSFTFDVEANVSCPNCLVLLILVEYKRQGEVVEFCLTLKAVHKLSTAADLPNSRLPSHSPSLPDEEQEASYFCSEDGLPSCGFTSSSTAQRDSTSSQSLLFTFESFKLLHNCLCIITFRINITTTCQCTHCQSMCCWSQL